MLTRSAILGLALLSFAVDLHAGDWTEFRGPTGQGIVEDGRLPTEWGPAKNVNWKQAIPGTGWSSPVIHRDRIFLTTAVPVPGSKTKDQSLRVLCLDLKSGKTRWQTEVFRQDGATAPAIHGKNSHASPTPVVEGERLYAHFGHMGTACLDLSGKVLWRSTHLKFEPVHGSGGSPIVVDDAVIFSVDGSEVAFVAALDRGTGKVLWKTERKVEVAKKFSFSTPLLITVNGRKQVISAGSNMVAAYDPRTGSEIWRVRYEGYSVIPRPVYGHGLLFVCTGYERPTVLAIRPDGKGDVTATHVAWSTNRAAPNTPSPLLMADELYYVSDNGIVSCLDAKTGQVHWQQRIGGNYSASPIAAGDRIYFQSEEGEGVVIRAGKRFGIIAKNALDERTLASYAAADGTLFIRTETSLYRFGSR